MVTYLCGKNPFVSEQKFFKMCYLYTKITFFEMISKFFHEFSKLLIGAIEMEIHYFPSMIFFRFYVWEEIDEYFWYIDKNNFDIFIPIFGFLTHYRNSVKKVRTEIYMKKLVIGFPTEAKKINSYSWLVFSIPDMTNFALIVDIHLSQFNSQWNVTHNLKFLHSF